MNRLLLGLLPFLFAPDEGVGDSTGAGGAGSGGGASADEKPAATDADKEAAADKAPARPARRKYATKPAVKAEAAKPAAKSGESATERLDRLERELAEAKTASARADRIASRLGDRNRQADLHAIFKAADVDPEAYEYVASRIGKQRLSTPEGKQAAAAAVDAFVKAHPRFRTPAEGRAKPESDFIASVEKRRAEVAKSGKRGSSLMSAISPKQLAAMADRVGGHR